MIKIAVCDDMQMVCTYIKNIIERHMPNEVEVDAFTTGRELVENALKKRYDIIFTDIELHPGVDGENGMDVSNRIKSAYPDVLIIFFSGMMGYERELLNFEPFCFITKPFFADEVISALDAAVKRINGWEDRFYLIRLGGGLHTRKNLKDIILFCSFYPFVYVSTLDGKIKTRDRIDNIEKKLSEMSKDFLRPNKSFLVNRNFIECYSSKELFMMNGERVTISRKYSGKFFEDLEK